MIRHTRKHRHVLRRSRSRRHTRRARIYKQKAGGDWQSFCAACGKPLSNWALDREPYNKPAEETAWMNRNVGFDSEHALILELGEDDMLGTAVILEEQDGEMNDILAGMDEEGTIDISNFNIQGDGVDFDPETQIGGIVIHKACERQLKKSGLNVTFDLVQKLYAGCRANKQYQDQEYEWEAALAANPNHHKSPLKSKLAKHELLFGCARDVPEMMTATEVREEMERRRRVINLKRYTNRTRKINLPLNIKKQLGSYLAAPANRMAGNRYASGNIVDFEPAPAAAPAALGGAGNGRAPPTALENVD